MPANGCVRLKTLLILDWLKFLFSQNDQKIFYEEMEFNTQRMRRNLYLDLEKNVLSWEEAFPKGQRQKIIDFQNKRRPERLNNIINKGMAPEKC